MSEVVTILYDHYKDTCNSLTSAINRREKTMLFVVLMLAAFTFLASSPESSATVLENFLDNQYGVVANFNFEVLGSIIWFLLLASSVRYFQASIVVERQYEYIHQLEDKINQKLGEGLIIREGKSYLADYPKFLDWVWLLYTVLFPLILVIVTLARIVGEWYSSNFSHNSFTLLNTIFFLFLVVTTVLYLTKVHRRNKENSNDNEH